MSVEKIFRPQLDFELTELLMRFNRQKIYKVLNDEFKVNAVSKLSLDQYIMFVKTVKELIDMGELKNG